MIKLNFRLLNSEIGNDQRKEDKYENYSYIFVSLTRR